MKQVIANKSKNGMTDVEKKPVGSLGECNILLTEYELQILKEKIKAAVLRLSEGQQFELLEYIRGYKHDKTQIKASCTTTVARFE